MKHFSDDWIQEWCDNNNWSDLFLESQDYWGFPPHAVMPLPISKEILMEIKASKGLTDQEKTWMFIAIIISLMSVFSSYFFHSPMPLVVAFAFTAMVVGHLELD